MGKIRGLFPYHLITFCLSAVSYILLKGYGLIDSIKFLLKSIPSLFFLQMTGIKCGQPNHVEWYLSVMLISILLLYPLLIRHYETMSKIGMLIISLFLLGYLSYTYTTLTGVKVWTGIAYKSLFRGIAEMALGVVAFEVTRWFDSLEFTSVQKKIFTVLEIISVVYCITFMLYTVSSDFEIYTLFVMFGLTILVFSRHTYYPAVFDSKIVLWLGKITLPIYLCQVAAVNFTHYLFVDLSDTMQLSIYVVMTLVFALSIMKFADVYMRYKSRC